MELAEVAGGELAEAFALIVRKSFGLPEGMDPVLARAPGRGWRCWVALDGDEPAGAAALYAAEGVGYLGLAGTLPEHRGKGAQSALLAARIRLAAEQGATRVTTETGVREPGRPDRSYRNILRAGFEEVAVRANWLRQRQTG